jgi:hypothetical protein
LVIAIAGSQGCSTPTAAGCGVGVLAGMALAGIAAASAKTDSSTTGKAVLGGSLFGIVSGCSGGGVAEAIARSDEKEHASARERGYSRVLYVRASQATPSPQVVTAQADLDGVKATWLGAPRTNPTHVQLRLQRYSSRPVITTCSQLVVRADDRDLRFPWKPRAQPLGSAMPETVQLDMDIDSLRAIASADAVEFDFCGLRRRLTLPAATATRDFASRFSAAASPGASVPARADSAESPQPDAAATQRSPSTSPADPVTASEAATHGSASANPSVKR